jgi:hypothetical protein
MGTHYLRCRLVVEHLPSRFKVHFRDVWEHAGALFRHESFPGRDHVGGTFRKIDSVFLPELPETK